MRNNIRTLVSSVVLAVGALAATQASAVSYTFGTVLSGTGPSPVSFATLSVVASGSDLQFSLSAPGLDLFGASSFLASIAVDGTWTGSVAGVSGDAPVSKVNGSGPGGSFDFRFDLTGPKTARLTDGESVSWTWAGAGVDAESLKFAAHVQGVDTRGGNSSSIWYSPNVVITPVPEPTTYALLLAGLGLVGAVARRRKA